jgi:hypothetical protein
MSETFCIVYVGKEDIIIEMTSFAFWILLVTRPLDTRAASLLSIAYTTIIAGSAFGHLLPFFENLFGAFEREKGIPVFVFEIHALCIIEKYAKIGPVAFISNGSAFSV